MILLQFVFHDLFSILSYWCLRGYLEERDGGEGEGLWQAVQLFVELIRSSKENMEEQKAYNKENFCTLKWPTMVLFQ